MALVLVHVREDVLDLQLEVWNLDVVGLDGRLCVHLHRHARLLGHRARRSLCPVDVERLLLLLHLLEGQAHLLLGGHRGVLLGVDQLVVDRRHQPLEAVNVGCPILAAHILELQAVADLVDYLPLLLDESAVVAVRL